MVLNLDVKRCGLRVRSMLSSPLAWIGLILIGAAIASNLSAGDDGLRPAALNARSSKAELMREGTRIESRRVKCRANTDHLTVEFDDGRQLDALANLAAQRLLQACRDDASDSYWIISGRITEFQNTNFLYVEHIVRSGAQ
jgi:hypothetical protein